MHRLLSICREDLSMCKMMVDKTMEMCDAESGKCKVKMRLMQNRTIAIKFRKGICGMDNMKE